MDYDLQPDCAIDLHIHSTASDGSASPREIIAMAQANKLGAIAITDHDTVDGARAALSAGIPDSLRFAAGVEFSAEIPPAFSQSGTLHILGYFLDLDNPELGRALALCQEARLARNPRIVEKLSRMGLPITLAEVEELAGEGQVGRPHIARVLFEKGAVATVDQAFSLYIGKGKPAYVGKFRLAAERAIAVIRESGGVAVLAHPSSLEMGDEELVRFVAALSQMGLAGIEVYYPGHSPGMIKKYLGLAREHDLAATGGTDFHGASKPEIKMGFGSGNLHVPYYLFENLAKRAARSATGGSAPAAASSF